MQHYFCTPVSDCNSLEYGTMHSRSWYIMWDVLETTANLPGQLIYVDSDSSKMVPANQFGIDWIYHMKSFISEDVLQYMAIIGLWGLIHNNKLSKITRKHSSRIHTVHFGGHH